MSLHGKFIALIHSKWNWWWWWRWWCHLNDIKEKLCIYLLTLRFFFHRRKIEKSSINAKKILDQGVVSCVVLLCHIFPSISNILSKIPIWRDICELNFFIRLWKKIRLIVCLMFEQRGKKWDGSRKINSIHFLCAARKRCVYRWNAGLVSASIDFIERIGLMELIFGSYNHDFMIASNICMCPTIFVCLTETSRTWEARLDALTRACDSALRGWEASYFLASCW